VTRPDGRVRRYHYNEADHLDPALAPGSYLTGLSDENNVRLSHYRYDDQGRVTQSGWGVENYQLSYGAGSTVVIDPLGTSREVGYQEILGRRRPVSVSQPGGSGCAASTSNRAYDANGNPTVEDNFNRHRSCRAYDLSRNLETVRVEGLANTAGCCVPRSHRIASRISMVRFRQGGGCFLTLAS
jgi:uncharacterized protein RhaS with RHS repeats